MLLESEERIARLEQMLETVEQRASEEARLRQDTERENTQLRAEIERLTTK